MKQLADYAIARHYPHCALADQPYLALLTAVGEAQAALIAAWMHVGFIHGVMNTDNMTISGETIDYGPCAFMDAFDPATVFSSIDHNGRYAYGNQPSIAQWNLARLAEALLELVHDDQAEAIALVKPIIQQFADRYSQLWLTGMGRKIGLSSVAEADETLIGALLALMQEQKIDHTTLFRSLGEAAVGNDGPARSLFTIVQPFDQWLGDWRDRLASEPADPGARRAAMDATNPIYIARNHLVETALEAAVNGDLAPFTELVDVLSDPYTEHPGLERFAQPAPGSFGPYRTFCGT